jgi:hypothetical protein
MAVTLTSTGITFSDSTTQNSAATASALGKQVFTSSGTFSVPTGVSSAKILVQGGGGNNGTNNPGPGGPGYGAPGAGREVVSSVTPGGSVGLTVGGAGGASRINSGATAIYGNGGGSGGSSGYYNRGANGNPGTSGGGGWGSSTVMQSNNGGTYGVAASGAGGVVTIEW